MTSAPPIRVVLAKVGLDGHDRGIKVVTHEADNEKNTMVDIEAFDNSAYGAGLNERLASCMHDDGKWAVLVGSLGSRSQVPVAGSEGAVQSSPHRS